ncbi:FUSC family protein [Pseudobutyrivibrio ruminis]|uniref:Fusaric acid resistance protein-like n=1 Tax=Pseudobutyrivibrio ruminis DSM 9787 TaxID=1123011 RepID=A0A285RTT3_9FIRM|nr:FUSC family protein [Pseudobutyrivibrio ruminis]SOB97185.1 Fusaric acid resistance protein-like [Pseudobutyrivibrio ruminis DSM 9787]
MNKTAKIPKIGMRIIKSAVAVFICFLIDDLRNEAGIVFYSQLSALWCMQANKKNTIKNAKQRFIGTIIGTIFGFIYIVVKINLLRNFNLDYDYIAAAVISVMIVVIIYTTVLVNKKQASYFSCVVFLSIAVNHIGDMQPYLFVWNRFLDTAIGILVGVGVNLLINIKGREQYD